ncbi:MAG: hypothetical protein JWO02_2508 [Solirubrobacterales bacterium]|nr:hypothetical protein [Solirubrobacterales bacterium]
MNERSRSGFLDPSGPLTGSNTTVFWLFAAATFVMVGASVLIAVREAVRLRSPLPLVLFASAALWLPNEPFIDTVLGFQYAADTPATLFTLAGRSIPVSALGIGAMFFLFTWFVYRLILSGATNRKIITVAVLAGIIDWPLEMLAIHYNVFEYYGDNPSRIFGLPLTSMVQNCFIYVFMACVFALSVPYIKGWRALLFLPIIPGCYYAVALLCTWPAYLALHGGAPTAVFIPLALAAAAINAYVPLTMLRLPAIQALRRGTLRPTDREVRGLGGRRDGCRPGLGGWAVDADLVGHEPAGPGRDAHRERAREPDHDARDSGVERGPGRPARDGVDPDVRGRHDE